MSQRELEVLIEVCRREGISPSELIRRKILTAKPERDRRMDELEARMLRIEGDLSKEAYKWRLKYEKLVANEKLKAERLESIDHVDGRSVAKLVVGGRRGE